MRAFLGSDPNVSSTIMAWCRSRGGHLREYGEPAPRVRRTVDGAV
jgi:hypothetical protein